MANIQKIIGKAYWTKLLGAPVKAYNPEEREWTIDVSLDTEASAFMSSLGLGKLIKNKHDARGQFFQFTRREFKKNTEVHNKPIKVVDAFGDDWPQDKPIGNGSVVEVKFNVFTVEAWQKIPAHNKAAVLEVRVLELVEYKRPVEDTSKVPGAQSWKGDVV